MLSSAASSFVVFFLADQFQDLSFADRQTVARQIRFRQERLDDDLRDARAQIEIAPKHLPDRMSQIDRRLRLERVAARASAKSRQHVLIVIVTRQQHRLRFRLPLREFLRRIDAIHDGHADIHHDNVRIRLGARLHRLMSVRDFADHLKAFPIEQRPQALSNHRVVFSNQDSNSHRTAPHWRPE